MRIGGWRSGRSGWWSLVATVAAVIAVAGGAQAAGRLSDPGFGRGVLIEPIADSETDASAAAGCASAAPAGGSVVVCSDESHSECAEFTLASAQEVPVFSALPPNRPSGECTPARCALSVQMIARDPFSSNNATVKKVLPRIPRPIRMVLNGREISSVPASAWRVGYAAVGDVLVPGASVVANLPRLAGFGRHTLVATVVDDLGKEVQATVALLLLRPPQMALLPQVRAGVLRVRVDGLREEVSYAVRRLCCPPYPAPPYLLVLKAASCRRGTCGAFKTYDRRALQPSLSDPDRPWTTDTVTLKARIAPGRYGVDVTAGGHRKRFTVRVN